MRPNYFGLNIDAPTLESTAWSVCEAMRLIGDLTRAIDRERDAGRTEVLAILEDLRDAADEFTSHYYNVLYIDERKARSFALKARAEQLITTINTTLRMLRATEAATPAVA